MNEPKNSPDELNGLSTPWLLIQQAHGGSTAEAPLARSALVLRYYGPVRRYLLALLKSEHEADDLGQDLMVRMMNGAFGNADPRRGRFRDYLKSAARNAVATYLARKGRSADPRIDAGKMAESEASEYDPDQEWLAGWRESFLESAWSRLEELERGRPGSLLYTVLRLRADRPDDDAEKLARRLSQAAGRSFTIDATRQQLHRARLEFAQILVRQIGETLDCPTPQAIQEELMEFGLLDYVRDLL